MRRVVAIIVAFAAVAFVTVAAQAESKGEQIFKQKCAMCHIVNGKGGAIGPDLTKVAANMKEGDLKAQMPSFKTLPKADMDALLSYLKTLK